MLPRPILLAIALHLAGLAPSFGGEDTYPAASEAPRPQPPAGVDTGAADANPLKKLWSWSDTRLRGIFESILPETQERRTWRLTVQPHFRDFLDEEHIRLPVGVVYGFNRRTEGELELDGYFPNPFDHGSKTGISNVRASLKRRWTPKLDKSVDAATGLSIVRPVTGSPYKLNEGVNRYSLFFTFARPSETIPELEAFLNLSYDLLSPADAIGAIDEDEPQDDFGRIATGVLYRKDRFTYGLSVQWAHTFDGDITNFVTLTPSVIYDVPRKFTFNTRGKWQIGAAVAAKRYRNESDLQLRIRVRWLIDFRKAWREWRESRDHADDPPG